MLFRNSTKLTYTVNWLVRPRVNPQTISGITVVGVLSILHHISVIAEHFHINATHAHALVVSPAIIKPSYIPASLLTYFHLSIFTRIFLNAHLVVIRSLTLLAWVFFFYCQVPTHIDNEHHLMEAIYHYSLRQA